MLRLMFIVNRDELYALHRMPVHCEEVLRATLRRYGGLFSDYVCIDEDFIANDCSIGREEVYEALKALTALRIVHYIPRKRTPYVTYLTRRVDVGEVFLPPEVYELRKAEYTERVKAMTDYADTDSCCRSPLSAGVLRREGDWRLRSLAMYAWRGASRRQKARSWPKDSCRCWPTDGLMPRPSCQATYFRKQPAARLSRCWPRRAS